MAVILTESAAKEVSRVREDQKIEPEMLLRIGVAGGGCSGFNYTLGFDKEYDETADTKYEQHGVEFVVDKKSEFFMGGTILDFNDGLLDRGFVFKNPQATGTCGCGTSFSA